MCRLLLISVCFIIHHTLAVKNDTVLMEPLKIFKSEGSSSNRNRTFHRPQLHAGISNAKTFLKTKLLENLNKYSHDDQALEMLEKIPENGEPSARHRQIEGNDLTEEEVMETTRIPRTIGKQAEDWDETNKIQPEFRPIRSQSTKEVKYSTIEKRTPNEMNPVGVSEQVASTIRNWRKKLYKAYREGKSYGLGGNKEKSETKDDRSFAMDKNRQILKSRKEPNWSQMFSEKAVYGRDKNGKVVRLFGMEATGSRAGAAPNTMGGIGVLSPPSSLTSLDTAHIPSNRVVYVPAPQLDKNPQYVIPPKPPAMNEYQQNIIPYSSSPIPYEQPAQYSTSSYKKLYYVTATPPPQYNSQFPTMVPLLQEFASGYSPNSRPQPLQPISQNLPLGTVIPATIAPYPAQSEFQWKPHPSTGEQSLGTITNQMPPINIPGYGSSNGGGAFPGFISSIGSVQQVNQPNSQQFNAFTVATTVSHPPSKGPGGFGKSGTQSDLYEDGDGDGNIDSPDTFDMNNECVGDNCPKNNNNNNNDLVETDEKCNSLRLRTVIQNNIVDSDAEASKRAVQSAAEKETGRYIDVICGTGFFSYIAHTDEFCLASSGGVNCYAFSPVCGDLEENQQMARTKKKLLSRNRR